MVEKTGLRMSGLNYRYIVLNVVSKETQSSSCEPVEVRPNASLISIGQSQHRSTLARVGREQGEDVQWVTGRIK